MSSDKTNGFRLTVDITFAVILIVLLALFVWDLSAENSHKARTADYYSKEYEKQTKERIASECAGIDTALVQTCIYEIIKSSRDAERSESDLYAQETMADMAFWLLWVTVGTLGVSIGGLVMLLRSLRQTETAIIDNREIGEAQTRAYIWPERPDFVVDEIKGQDSCRVRFVWKNSGSSPAMNCISASFGLPARPDDEGKQIPFHLLRPNPEKSFAIPPQNGQMGLQIDNFNKGQIARWKKGEIVLLLYSIVDFDDVFGNRFRVQSCLRAIYKKDGLIEVNIYKEHNQAQTQIS